MHKLETKGASLPQARCLLVVQSIGHVAAVALLTESIREMQGEQWVDSAANVRQIVAGYVAGEPIKLSAKVSHLDAVEIASCHRVVVEVEVKVVLTQAFEKGDKSKQIVQVSLLRVVEVWETAEKRLWAAKPVEVAHPAPVELNGGAISKAQLTGAR